MGRVRRLALLVVLFAAIADHASCLGLSVRVQAGGDGLPAASTPAQARTDVATRSAVTSVSVSKLQKQPQAWRVQVRTATTSLDPARAYTWRCQARSTRRVPVQLNLVETSSGRTVGDMQVQLTPQWQSISMQTFQVQNRGNYQVQVWLGDVTGTFSFRNSSLSSTTLDRSFLSSIDSRIRQHRQRTFYLSVSDEGGSDVAVQGLNLTLQRHAFTFGTAISPETVQVETPA